MSKPIGISSKYELEEAVFRHVGNLHLHDLDLVVNHPSSSVDTGADFWFDVRLDGRERRFDVDCRLHPAARDVTRLKERQSKNAALLAAAHLPESLVGYCREQGVSCLDLNGRLYLRHTGLLVDRQSETRQYRGSQPEPALFADKSSRLARWFLSYANRLWRQDELAERTGCSAALVSRLMGEYARLGWTEHEHGGWRVVRAEALLDAWTGADAWSKRGVVRQYSTLERQPAVLAEQVVSLLGGTGRRLAFTQWFAAAHRHFYTELPVVSAYCTSFPSQAEARELGWREVANGGRLWLIVPRDEGVFQCRQQGDGVPLVCDTQIYLDLLQVGWRGPDAARALREWEGFRQS